jgi:hypothetical protein
MRTGLQRALQVEYINIDPSPERQRNRWQHEERGEIGPGRIPYVLAVD